MGLQSSNLTDPACGTEEKEDLMTQERSRRNKLATLLAALALAATACGSTYAESGGSSLGDPSQTVADQKSDSAQVMAAAIRELVSKDHTFGEGPPPFSQYLIQSQLDQFAGNPTGIAGAQTRPLTDEERAAINDVLAPIGPVRFIEDPDDWRTKDLTPTIDSAVILGVGEPLISDSTATVPVSLWCGGLCGTWLTYRLDLEDGGWQVVGTEGPIAIS